jgi:hypothetical protein
LMLSLGRSVFGLYRKDIYNFGGAILLEQQTGALRSYRAPPITPCCVHVELPSVTPCSSKDSAKGMLQPFQCHCILSEPHQNLKGQIRKTKTTPISRGGFSDIFEGELDGRDGKVRVHFTFIPVELSIHAEHKVAIKIFRGTSLLLVGDSSQSKAINGPSSKHSEGLSADKMREVSDVECISCNRSTPFSAILSRVRNLVPACPP